MTLDTVALALLVSFVGMPHGGLDHRVGKQIFIRDSKYDYLLFISYYLVVMLFTASLWYLNSIVAVICFVIISSKHFADSELLNHTYQSWIHQFIHGSMVVWLPAYFQTAEFTYLLKAVTSGTWPSWLLNSLLFDYFVAVFLLVVMIDAYRSSIYFKLITLIKLCVFCFTPPLVAFIIYFCGWHSAVELYRLAELANPQNRWSGLITVIRTAAPNSALAVLGIFLGWFYFRAGKPLNDSVIQAVFVGLSIVAVPHMILCMLAERTGVHAFSEVRTC